MVASVACRSHVSSEKFGIGVAADLRITAKSLRALKKLDDKAEFVKKLKECGASPALMTRLGKTTKQNAYQLLESLFDAATQCFHKGFSSHEDRCGGTVDLFCPHGVVYGLTPLPKSESPQDAISLVTWLRHLPNVVFYDWQTSANPSVQLWTSETARLSRPMI